MTKTVPVGSIVEACRAGLLDLGENRVQEAASKRIEVEAALEQSGPPGSVRPLWHLVGRLQSNKARRAAGLFDWIQSLDSARLADSLDRHAGDLGRRLDVLIEVNVSGEAAKAGVSPGEAVALVRHAAAKPGLAVRGLMTVGPRSGGAATARPGFRALARLLEEARAACPELPLSELSMGMSGDFEAAIEEGATMVRLGTALFGPRAPA